MITANSIKEIEKETGKRMDKSLEVIHREFQAVRTGRASTMLVESVVVNYYGTPTPLKSLANLSTPDPKTIMISPWDAGALGEIEKALQVSDLGVNPINDGKAIRIQIPSMTQDKRQELIKTVRRIAEEGKISLRNGRHEAIEAIKKLEKNKQASEDESHTSQKHIQKLTDDHTKKIDEYLKAKETELQAI